MQSALIFWLVEALRPKVIAVLAADPNASPGSFQLVVHAVTKAGLPAMTVLGIPAGGAAAAPVSAEAKATSRVVQGSLSDLHREFSPGTIDLLLMEGQSTDDQLGRDIGENWRELLSPAAVVLWHDVVPAKARPALEALGARSAEIASVQSGSGMLLAVIGDAAPASVLSLRKAPAGGPALAFLNLLMRLGEGQEAAAEVAHLRGQIKSGSSAAEAAEQAARVKALQESLDQVRQGYDVRHERAVASAIALDDYRRATTRVLDLLRDAAVAANPADALTASLVAEAEILPDPLREVIAVAGRLIQQSNRLLAARLDDIVAIERDASDEIKTLHETIANVRTGATETEMARKTEAEADASSRSLERHLKQENDASLRSLERQLKQAKEQARKAQRKLQQIESSTSWRITSPLRGAKSLLTRSKD